MESVSRGRGIGAPAVPPEPGAEFLLSLAYHSVLPPFVLGGMIRQQSVRVLLPHLNGAVDAAFKLPQTFQLCEIDCKILAFYVRQIELFSNRAFSFKL